MKKDIHPKWYTDAKIICGCGNVFTMGSTMPEIHVEICSKCHPFYTGEQKLIDTEGRVEKFNKRVAKSQNIKQKVDEKVKKQEEKKTQSSNRPSSLKDMLKAANK